MAVIARSGRCAPTPAPPHASASGAAAPPRGARDAPPKAAPAHPPKKKKSEPDTKGQKKLTSFFAAKKAKT